MKCTSTHVNRFVAEFIGNVNLFNGTVVSDERDSATFNVMILMVLFI